MVFAVAWRQFGGGIFVWIVQLKLVTCTSLNMSTCYPGGTPILVHLAKSILLGYFPKIHAHKRLFTSFWNAERLFTSSTVIYVHRIYPKITINLVVFWKMQSNKNTHNQDPKNHQTINHPHCQPKTANLWPPCTPSASSPCALNVHKVSGKRPSRNYFG